MRIALFSAYYWPEYAGTAPYITAPAEYLASLGHEVHVAAAFPHYPEWKELEPRKFASKTVHNGVTIHRRWHTIPKTQSARKRGVYEASMLATGLTQFAGLPRPDVIVGVSPALASASLARMASTVYRRPYGLIIHDLFGKGAEQTGMGGGKLSSSLNAIEMSVARKAKRLLVLTDAFKEFFVAGGFDPERIDVAPPWSLREIKPIDRDAVRERLGWRPDQFVAVHAGNMGQKQGLSNIIEAAKVLSDQGEDSVRIVMIGDGNDRKNLEAMVRSYGLKNVQFTMGLPNDEYDAAISAADVLLLNQRPSVSDMSLPSKMTAYFAAGRPVIAAVAEDSAAADSMRAAGAGPIVDPADADALASSVVRLRKLSASDREKLGSNGNAYSNTELSSEKLLHRYAEFADVLNSGNPA